MNLMTTEEKIKSMFPTPLDKGQFFFIVVLMVFNATHQFSAISWHPVFIAEEARVLGKNPDLQQEDKGLNGIAFIKYILKI